MALVHIRGFAFLASARETTLASGRSVCLALLFFGLLAVLLLGIEISTGARLGRLVKLDSRLDLPAFAGASAILAVLTWPVLFLIILRTRNFLWPVIFVCTVLVVLTHLTMFSSVVSLIVGLIAFLMTYKYPARAPIAVVALFAVLFVSAPWISRDGVNLQSFGSNISVIPNSFQHRLGIWNFVSGKALERPLLGHGYDASRRLGRGSEKVQIVLTDNPRRTSDDSALPLHPHNTALQIWLELGAVRVALSVILLIALTKAIVALRFRPPSSAMATATLTSFLSISSVSYGIWQKWWLATAWIAATACVLVIRQAEAMGPTDYRS